MKLLFLTEFFPRDKNLIFTGGVEARVYYIVQQAKKDFSVKIISSSSKKIPATIISVFTRIYYLFSSFFQALKTDFDILEASNFVSYLPAFFAAKLKRKKAIAWFPDILNKDWFQFGKFVGLSGFILEKISLRLSWDHVIALSRSTKNKLIKAGIDKTKVTVVHGGIDPQEFNIKPPKKFTSFTIICVARLVRTKQIQDLITAFQKIKQAQLLIIGQGPLEKELKQLAKNLNLQNQIKFQKNLTRQQLIRTLCKSHLFCLPSTVEGFGLVTIEAMSAGLPVVVTDIPTNQEITKKGQGTLFFKPFDSNDLAKKILKLKNNPQLYQKKQTQAKKLASSYSWKKIYQQTKKVYEDCYSS
ncbi:glycosyltransferase family 4 protein [Patescibacteria group bacterium]